MEPAIHHMVDLEEYIDYTLMSGRPHVRGRRVDIPTIVTLAESLPIAAVADELALDVPQVVAALLYYERNKAVVDASVAEDKQHHAEGRQRLPAKFDTGRRSSG
jgi:uncharacterized protein (DUF433 family)